MRFRLRPLDVLILLHENGTFGSPDLTNVEETLAGFADDKFRPKWIKVGVKYCMVIVDRLCDRIETLLCGVSRPDDVGSDLDYK